MKVREMKEIERAMIAEHISKTGRTRACGGYRYRVTSKHGRDFFDQDKELEEGTIPAFHVTVEQMFVYTTCQGFERTGFRKVRAFTVDGLGLIGLRQIPARHNA